MEGAPRAATPGKARWACLLYALAGALAVGGWQAATVQVNYGGNWTALFCAGELQEVPPELAPGTYIFKSSTGYDGQFYRYVAHDPWLKKGWWKYHDAPGLRYRRILVPGLAWLLAGGQSRYIDAAYLSVVLLSVFLGSYWLGRYAVFHGRSAAWGLGFVFVPAALASIDSLTVDVALAALCAAFVWYLKRASRVGLYLVLVLAGLTRETGLLLTGAYCCWALWNRRWRQALLFATTALPALAWYQFIAAHFTAHHVGHGGLLPPWAFHYPLVGIVIRLFQTEPYPFDPLLTHLIQVMDAVALCGFLLALGWAAWGLRRGRWGQEQWATLAFIALTLAVSAPGFWKGVYSYGRPVSPLVFLVGLRALSGGSPWALAPMAMMDLRLAARLVPQVFSLWHSLLR